MSLRASSSSSAPACPGGTCPGGSARGRTVHGRFARWAADGTFDRILRSAQSRAEVDGLVAVDSTVMPAHQYGAAKGGSKKAVSAAPAAARREGGTPGQPAADARRV